MRSSILSPWILLNYCNDHLNELPSGLKKIYHRVAKQIQTHCPATVSYCIQLLSTLVIAKRSLRLIEVVTTIKSLKAKF